MLPDYPIDKSKARRFFAAEHRRILSLSPEDAVNAILDHPRARALVQSLPDEDFYFLVCEVGPDDSSDILALASRRQWEHILDLEAWKKDRFDIEASIRWIDLLLAADPARTARWLLYDKAPMTEYILGRCLEVRVLEHDQDPSELGDGFETLDGVYYFRLKDEREGIRFDELDRKEAEEFFSLLARRMAAADFQEFMQVLARSAVLLPAESEEEAYRLRSVRLGEKGFLPYEEAIGIYAPLDISKLSEKRSFSSEDEERELSPPLVHNSLIPRAHILVNALSRIEPGAVADEIQLEFAALCNRIVSADGHPSGEKGYLASVVRKACGYISIGIQRIAGTPSAPDPEICAAILRRYPLADIFRVGYGIAITLKTRAIRWYKKSWVRSHGLGLAFFGEYLLGWVGGLMLKRPKAFADYAEGSRFKEFESIEEINEAAKALDAVMAFDSLIAGMKIDPTALVGKRFLSHENFMLTLWARKRLGMEPVFAPIPKADFIGFFEKLFARNRPEPVIVDELKADFLAFLAESSGQRQDEISKVLSQALERLFARLEQELGHVAPQDIDPRYVLMFILE